MPTDLIRMLRTEFLHVEGEDGGGCPIVVVNFPNWRTGFFIDLRGGIVVADEGYDPQDNDRDRQPQLGPSVRFNQNDNHDAVRALRECIRLRKEKILSFRSECASALWNFNTEEDIGGIVDLTNFPLEGQ